MERRSRSELLQYIEEQKQLMQKYQTRFHDVVNSYKRLLKEKETLEESVKLLTQTDSQKESDAEAAETEKNSDSGQETPNTPDEKEPIQNLSSLKSNLRTLTLEKSRIETELKTDRIRLLRENEELQKKIATHQEMNIEEKIKAENYIKELKKQIRDQQIDRDKEQQNHSLMLKELQSLVADERSAKEKLEQQVEKLKIMLEKITDKREEYEEKMQDLRNQLRLAKDKLHEVEVEKRGMPSLLQKLQKEMNEMKKCHQEAVDREICRANEAEEKLKALAMVSEERAASLEQRLSDLSQMVGSYDKFRQQDQIAIQKLKERVAQLDQENCALAKTVATAEKNFEFNSEKKLDAQTIMEEIIKLQEYLHAADHKKYANISTILKEMLREDEVDLHATCQKEIKQLREELDKFKHKEKMSQNNSVMEMETVSELSILKKQVSNLQNELQICKDQLRATDEQSRASDQHFHDCLKELMTKHKRELTSQKKEFQLKVFELELQVQKQRERSLALLEDKDKEINSLKQQVPKKTQRAKENGNSQGVFNTEDLDLSGDDSPLEVFTPSIPVKKGKQILYYAQEMSRKDIEISNLRRGKAKAENSLRELQQNSALKEEIYKNDIDSMNSQMRRLESIQSGINMEYLKNVVLRYIKSSKPGDQSHMLNAIASILHFTTLELEEARGHLQLY